MGKNRWAPIASPVGLHIVYLTTWVDDNGVLNFRDDVYGLDKKEQATP